MFPCGSSSQELKIIKLSLTYHQLLNKELETHDPGLASRSPHLSPLGTLNVRIYVPAVVPSARSDASSPMATLCLPLLFRTSLEIKSCNSGSGPTPCSITAHTGQATGVRQVPAFRCTGGTPIARNETDFSDEVVVFKPSIRQTTPRISSRGSHLYRFGRLSISSISTINFGFSCTPLMVPKWCHFPFTSKMYGTPVSAEGLYRPSHTTKISARLSSVRGALLRAYHDTPTAENAATSKSSIYELRQEDGIIVPIKPIKDTQEVYATFVDAGQTPHFLYFLVHIVRTSVFAMASGDHIFSNRKSGLESRFRRCNLLSSTEFHQERVFYFLFKYHSNYHALGPMRGRRVDFQLQGLYRRNQSTRAGRDSPGRGCPRIRASQRGVGHLAHGEYKAACMSNRTATSVNTPRADHMVIQYALHLTRVGNGNLPPWRTDSRIIGNVRVHIFV
ncbi:hypothetical protein FB451DRAFT_1176713 [Mycena latifolia]|nr:hypothetical protein FB451DRAFT_1176713 [Mycena latifolia]